MGFEMGVAEVASSIRDIRSINADSWPPVRVEFEVFTPDTFDFAPARMITRKLEKDKQGYGRILLLEEAPVQDCDTVSVPWDQFEKAVARGRSEAPLLVLFEDPMFGARFTVERMEYDAENHVLKIDIEQDMDYWL